VEYHILYSLLFLGRSGDYENQVLIIKNLLILKNTTYFNRVKRRIKIFEQVIFNDITEKGKPA